MKNLFVFVGWAAPTTPKSHLAGGASRWLSLFLFFLVASISAHAELSVSDDSGATVSLKQPARRIVSLAPHVTEILFAAGAGEYLLGAVEYSDYPQAALKIPRVGGYSSFDIERIVALRPDLVVAWQSGNPVAQVEKLRDLGLTVYLSEPRRIEDVATNIERLGELAGTSASARRSAQAFRAKQEQLQRRYRGRSPVTMFYQIWDKPMMTVNGAHIVSDVIRLCGGRNVFASLPVLAPTVDIEAVLAADPEAIVAGGMNQEQPLWLRDWRRWPQMRAVRRNNLFFIPPDLLQRHTPRILEGAERLCRALDAARERR